MTTKWETGQVVADEYVVERLLGRGGMGRVWLVKSNSTGRRFAVKQSLIKDDKHRKAFLAELQSWIDLPEHPNIVPCRFFRTVGDEIVIFADYIEGGSLAEWIAKKKLTSLQQILDVAIQFAWGLHAIHERGLIHQDVKPGNVLMTADGTPMITDFGLARARLRGGDNSFFSPALQPGRLSVLVSVGGMTPAYASPEQRAGQPLSRKTDIWSWGVSVLDMFTGGVSCPHGGQIAAEVLESFAEHGQQDDALLEMPHELTVLLQKCFDRMLEKRASNFFNVIDALKGIYEHSCNTKYKQLQFVPINQKLPQQSAWVLDRYDKTPDEWLMHARRAAGLTDTLVTSVAISEQGNLVQAMTVMTDACGLLAKVLKTGRLDIARDYVDASWVRADLHRRLSDWNGCLAVWKDVADLLSSALKADSRLPALLAEVLYWQGQTLADSGQPKAACQSCQTAMSILISLPLTQSTLVTLAKTYQIHAKSLAAQGLNDEARTDYRDAVDALQEFASQFQDDIEIQRALALTLHNWGGLECEIGSSDEAISLFQRAIRIREKLVVRLPGDQLLRSDLAGSYSSISSLLAENGGTVAAFVAIEKAVALREQLADGGKRGDFREGLAKAYFNKAGLLLKVDRFDESAREFSKALTLFKNMVHLEGKNDLLSALTLTENSLQIVIDKLAQSALEHLQRGEVLKAIAVYTQTLEIRPDNPDLWMYLGAAYEDAKDTDRALEAFEHSVRCREVQDHVDPQIVRYHLANSYLEMANLQRGRGLYKEACALYERGISIRVECIERDGRKELLPNLANAHLNHCAALSQVGQRKAARVVVSKAIGILEELVHKQGRKELLDNLANAHMNAACVEANLGLLSSASAHLENTIGIYGQMKRTGHNEHADKLANALKMREQLRRDIDRTGKP